MQNHTIVISHRSRRRESYSAVVRLCRVEFAYEFSQHGGMSTKGQRLAAAVLARRDDLDRTQLDVWQAGGPSNTTLTKVESGEIETLSRVTARKLDAGLSWAPGSAKRLFEEGTPPLPLPADVDGMHRDDVRRLAEQIEAARVDDETRAELLRVLRTRGGWAG